MHICDSKRPPFADTTAKCTYGIPSDMEKKNSLKNYSQHCCRHFNESQYCESAGIANKISLQSSGFRSGYYLCSVHVTLNATV